MAAISARSIKIPFELLLPGNPLVGKNQACQGAINRSSTYNPGHFPYLAGFAKAFGSLKICFPGSISRTCKDSALRDSRKVATESGPEGRRRDYNSKEAEYLADSSNSPAHNTGLYNVMELRPQAVC